MKKLLLTLCLSFNFLLNAHKTKNQIKLQIKAKKDIAANIKLILEEKENKRFHSMISNSITISIPIGVLIGLQNLKKLPPEQLKNSPSSQWIINNPIKYSLIAGITSSIVFHAIHYFIKKYYKRKNAKRPLCT